MMAVVVVVVMALGFSCLYFRNGYKCKKIISLAILRGVDSHSELLFAQRGAREREREVEIHVKL